MRCTSSPNLSISAFKRSFCSVSSCTFRSFSCSLSLRLFLADKYEDEEDDDVAQRCCDWEEEEAPAGDDEAPSGPSLRRRLPGREGE